MTHSLILEISEDVYMSLSEKTQQTGLSPEDLAVRWLMTICNDPVENFIGAFGSNIPDWADQHDVQLPTVPDHCEQSYHMFYMLMPDLDLRQRLIRYLRERGIYSVFHYLPLHLSDMGRGFGGREGDCPVTERISDQLIRLPFHNVLTGTDQEQVIEAILEFKF